MRRLAGPLLLFVLCVGFYWKLTLTSDYTFLDSPDLANLDLPRLQFQSTAWRQGYLPLWDPLQWAGQPFLGQITSAAYPVNWFLGYFPVDDRGKLTLNGIHWYYVILHFAAALFCYLLCRDWKRSEPASIAGGLVFGLGGFAGTTDWPQILNGILWLPLIVLLMTRAFRGRRVVFSGAMSGAILGLTWLSGHHEVPIYMTTALAMVWIVAFAVAPRRMDIVKAGAAAAIALVLISAVQILPAQEYAQLSKRWVGVDGPVTWNEAIPYSVHRHYSWSTDGILGIVTPRVPVHVNPFIGVVAFSLMVLGVYHGWRRLPQVRILVGLGLAGLFLALAANNNLHGLFYAALPVFGKARVPARAIALFSFAAGPLAAYGYDALARRSSLWLKRTVVTLTAAGVLFYLAAAYGVRAAQPQEQPLMTALMAILAAVLLAGWRAGSVHPRLLAVAVTLLVLVEIGNVSARDLHPRKQPHPGYIDKLYQHDDIANYLRARPQPVRMEVSDADIPYNFGDWHGIPILGGFAASITSNVLELEKHKPRVQDLLGINYYVGHTPPRPDITHLTDSSSGLNIYHNPNALPRAWTVHRATQVRSMSVINTRLDSAEFQPRGEALMLGAPPELASCGEPDTVGPPDGLSPNRVHIEATLGCRGLLILSDTWFPGWRARVDGKDTEILPVFGALRGIVLEKGRHHVEFSYLPESAIYGAAGTALGVLFVLCTLWSTRKRRPA